MSANQNLSHPFALLDGEELIEIGELERLCQRDSTHSEARRIAAAGREHRLTSPHCGSLLHTRYFDRGKKRWHFVRYASEPQCVHESDELDHSHSSAVMKLADTLSEKNPAWRVFAARPMKRVPRVPDVLAVHKRSGTGIVFEVQKSRPNKSEWLERREDLKAAGVATDQWFMLDRGRLPWQDDSDFLKLLQETPGQRALYLGRFRDEDELQGYERVVYYKRPHPIPEVQNLSYMAAPEEGVPADAFDVHQRWRPYTLSKIQLVEEPDDTPDGRGRVSLHTGRDDHLVNRRRWRAETAEYLEAEHDRADRERRERERAEQDHTDAGALADLRRTALYQARAPSDAAERRPIMDQAQPNRAEPGTLKRLARGVKRLFTR